MQSRLLIGVMVTVMAVFCSCNRIKPQIPSNTEDTDQTAQDLIAYNKLCLEDERREIDAFLDSVKTHGELFTRTDDGYWIRLVLEGPDSVDEITEGSNVAIAYSLELLDGTICYQSTDGEIRRFRVGKREVEKGLDIAVAGMHLGDEAELILPYNLAHGVAGDRGCVPPRTPILYRFKILSVE